MQKKAPQKTFIPAPPEEAMVETLEGKQSCACNECEYMKMNTMQKIYDCLKNESPQVEVPQEIIKEAVKPIERMLELS
jgi:quinolinate synthase